MKSRETRATSHAEDYLERIHVLIEQKGYARVSDIATELKLSRPSVSAMVKRLSQRGFLVREPYRGLALTDKGRDLAHRIRSRHSILTDFFDLLGIEPKIATQDVEGIEHCISAECLEKLALLSRYWREKPATLRRIFQSDNV